MLKKLTFLLLILMLPTLLFAYKHNKRELRAVWVTTLLNLDWPSKAGLSMNEQKEEFINTLTKQQFDKIENFFVTSPKVVQVVESDCPKCNKHNVNRIEGLETFFV